jgi:hypothetical protein
MNDIVTYEWTKELAAGSLRAVHKVYIGRTGFMIAGGLISFVIGMCNYFFLDKSIGIVLCVIGFVLSISPLRTYYLSRRLAKDAARLIDNPKITLTITDESITISSNNSSRTIEWNRMTKLREVDEFLLLFTGKLLTISIPGESLSNEQLEFICAKMNKR